MMAGIDLFWQDPFDRSPHLLVRRGDVISDTFIASLSTW
jgi:hypothetical protein